MIKTTIEAKLVELSHKDEPTTSEANLMRDCEIALGRTAAKSVTVAAAWKRCRKALGV